MTSSCKKYFVLVGLLLCAPSIVTAQGRAGSREIAITSEPGAVVWLDGVRYGKTDKSGSLSIKTVSSGAHSLRLRADGFKEKVQPLTALQKGTVNVPLIKTTDEAELSYQEAERLATSDREK